VLRGVCDKAFNVHLFHAHLKQMLDVERQLRNSGYISNEKFTTGSKDPSRVSHLMLTDPDASNNVKQFAQKYLPSLLKVLYKPLGDFLRSRGRVHELMRLTPVVFINVYEVGEAHGASEHRDSVKVATAIVNITGDHGASALFWKMNQSAAPVFVKMNAGDIVLMDADTLHGVKVSVRSEERITLNVFYG
jgi:hypothetical protein